MRIYNKRTNPVFLRYAGRGPRGVDLKPREESPDLPALRLQDAGVQKDLRIGNIGVIVSEAEIVTLRGVVPESALTLCDVAKAPAGSTVPFTPTPIPTVPTPEAPPPAAKPIVIEKAVVPPKVDPVKQEVERAVDQTAEPQKQARLDQLKQSENPAVAKAAEQVQADQAAKAAAEQWTSKDDGPEAPARPGQPGVDTSKYRGLPKHLLLSECLKRGINDVNPTTSTKDLRRRLAENDLRVVGR